MRSEQPANSEVEKHKPARSASLFIWHLQLQKAKELDLPDKVEAEVNKRMLDVAKENGIT